MPVQQPEHCFARGVQRPAACTKGRSDEDPSCSRSSSSLSICCVEPNGSPSTAYLRGLIRRNPRLSECRIAGDYYTPACLSPFPFGKSYTRKPRDVYLPGSFADPVRETDCALRNSVTQFIGRQSEERWARKVQRLH